MVSDDELTPKSEDHILPYQEGEQPLRYCPECGKALATYNKPYYYQCLKPTCKRCNYGLPLCPEHFASIPFDGKKELLT